jgi:exonuclease III
MVCAIAHSTGADIVVLLENEVDVAQTLATLRANVAREFYVPNFSPTQRFHCFCRDHQMDMAEVHISEGVRTSVRKLWMGSSHLLLALVHGVDPRNYDLETRQSFAQSLATEMQFVRGQQATDRLILMGDFNMNPYDRSMNLAAGLNAMMTRECAQAESRRHLAQNYDFYYNPMWSLFGDNTPGPAGTVYDSSSQGPYGWSMFDQVILHYSLIPLFQGVEILTKAGELSLTNSKGRPDGRNASDHFPIMLTLGEENNG